MKEHFKRTDGLADSEVTILDPSAGTLTFLTESAKLAVQEFVSKYGEGGKEKFISEHILKNFYAFEIMMAPYAVGHHKMSFLLEELGYKLKEDDRFKLYLTNTLEIEELPESKLPGMSSLSKESQLAGEVKRKTPILVVVGNPPYSGISANMKPEMVNFLKRDIDGLQSYYKVDGKPLGEKNPKWLQDDYVKFIRFAQWKIQQSKEGVLGFITNHSYLDNPTFRGMRQSLMKTFDEIYVLDLHGNSLKKEKCPDGSKDENVFDIQQGVSIAFFIKKKERNENCQVYHSEIWGLREYKYKWLSANDIFTTEWKKLSPKSEFYLFIPREEKHLELYEKYPKITDIFPLNGVGITTARDKFVIDNEKNALLNRIRLFKNSKFSDDELHEFFQINKKKGWSIRKAWNMLQSVSDLSKLIYPILYRPFDIRWIFYYDPLIERSRREVMTHMLHENLGLITRRQMLPNRPCNYIFVSELMISDGVIRSDNKGGESLFPLYIYHSAEKESLLNDEKMLHERKPNINQKLFSKLSEIYKKELIPEEIFYYIYAILYSNIYRTKYADFLRIDFPRIPFTKNHKVFTKMVDLGKILVELHLLKSDELNLPVAKLEGKGENLVQKVRYEHNRVFINKVQYFDGIKPQVWSYQIGGYQVCNKWLKDKKGRMLSLDEIKQYCRIVTAIEKTIEIQTKIDEIYPNVEKDLIFQYYLY